MTMSQPHWKAVFATALCAAACSQPGLAQVAPAVILEIQQENMVQYFEDISDVSKYATDPSVTTACFPINDPRVECAGRHQTFHSMLILGDIVAINGQAVKGTIVIHGRRIQANPSPSPGQAIADVVRNIIQQTCIEILTVDGRAIGSIILSGLGDGPPPPGAPLSQFGNNQAIVGGTGAFLGARGQMGYAPGVTTRAASIAEDPAKRRTNGGGLTVNVVHLIPMTRPEVAITSSGPAIFHADFSPVTAAKPAKAGEVLIVKATGLGPTVPGINPGQPFPTDALQQVNSPVAVAVNGQAAEVINSIGWPGLMDTYRVDFRLPAGATGGAAAIQLSAAWVAGSSVNIPIQ